MFQYLESMSEMIRKGIEEANKDLKVEQEHKLVQEVNIVPEIVMCVLFGVCVGVCGGEGGGMDSYLDKFLQWTWLGVVLI